VDSKINGGTYKIGYGKPPQQSQFKKGESGNKKGRPKGSKNVATVFHGEINERVLITENGKCRTITKLEAAIKQIVNKAAAGDAKAIRALLQLSKELGDLSISVARQRVDTIIRMVIPAPAPGEDRSYRDDPSHLTYENEVD
jgi:hypothetical protein